MGMSITRHGRIGHFKVDTTLNTAILKPVFMLLFTNFETEPYTGLDTDVSSTVFNTLEFFLTNKIVKENL